MLIREIANNAPVRVCDECFRQSYRNRKESISSSIFFTPSKQVAWVLSTDDLQNDSLRSEFYYDSAPSVSLCLALLKLHTDKLRCCKILVDQVCKPLLEVIATNHVDCGVIVSMVRSLLTSAKMMLVGTAAEGLVRSIDALLERTDAIRMLINANCHKPELISCLIGSENPYIRLQEKLIEMERFELARDLATKYGLDVKGIWRTWGLVCLKNRRFMEARQKFQHCLDGQAGSEGANSRTLDDILRCLDKPKSGFLSLREKCELIRKGRTASRDLYQLSQKESHNFCFKEALFYLEKYGTKEQMVRFYAKNSMWRRAVEVLLEDAGAQLYNAFVSELFVAAMKRGAIREVLDCLRSHDPTFARSWRYLVSTCKYLSRNDYFNTLHLVQLFMGDYLRAAMTQVNYFYLYPPASDYTELHHRMGHLQTAKQHCQDFLGAGETQNGGCLRLPPSDVMKQIRAINLQMEVSSKFSEKAVKGFVPFDVDDDRAEPFKSPPTLLDHNVARKTELAALVVVNCGATIPEGFTLCQQIIKASDGFRFSQQTF